MSLRERVHALRKEHGWSQGELAEKVGADPAQISRYENGRITPSADVVVRIAEVFDVSTDYLLVGDAPRRPFRRGDEALGERLSQVIKPGTVHPGPQLHRRPRHQDPPQSPRRRHQLTARPHQHPQESPDR